MRTTPRSVILLLSLPFLTGCFGVLPGPLPPPAERASAQIQGVVVRTPDGGEREVRYEEIYNADWTQTSLFLIGSLREEENAPPVDVTREYAYDDLAGILTRQVDAGKTSLVVAGTVLGAVAALVFHFTGQVTDRSVLGVG